MLSLALFLLAATPNPAPSEADQLFGRARELLKTRPVEACALFEKSFDLDPALGTLLNLAVCLETISRVASASRRFNQALAWAERSNQSERAALAREHLRALAPRLAKLVLTVEATAPDLQLQLDGEPLTFVRGAPVVVEVDPGTHTLTATARGYLGWQARPIAPAEGQNLAVVVPALAPVAAPEAARPPPALTLEAPSAATAPGVTTLSPSPAPSRTGGVVAVAAGAALFAAGAVGVGYSVSVYIRAQPQRVGGDAPPAEPPTVSRAELETARTLYPLSLTAVGVGAASTALGIFLLSRTGAPVAVGLGPVPGGQQLTVWGAF